MLSHNHISYQYIGNTNNLQFVNVYTYSEYRIIYSNSIRHCINFHFTLHFKYVRTKIRRIGNGNNSFSANLMLSIPTDYYKVYKNINSERKLLLR